MKHIATAFASTFLLLAAAMPSVAAVALEDLDPPVLLPDGTTSPIALTFDRVVLLSPSAPSSPSPREEREGREQRDRRRLAALVETYRRIQELTVAQTLWHYTALESGLHSSYPGHGGYPPGFCPPRHGGHKGERQKHRCSERPPTE